MADFKKAKMLDPYSLMRAIARSAQDGEAAHGDPAAVRPGAGPAGDEGTGGAHAGGWSSAGTPGATPRTKVGVGPGAVPMPAIGAIGKTIQPTRRTIRCFECGYEFQLSGTVGAIYCSRCRARIELGDVTVTGEQREDIRTGGTVHVKPGGVVKAGVRIMAGNIILEGTLEPGASVTCTQWLEIGPGAVVSARQLDTRKLRVAKGAEVRFSGKLAVQHVEIHGLLEADLEAEGLISLRADGILRGTVRGSHLQVEEGATLEARMFIWGPERPDVPGGSGR